MISKIKSSAPVKYELLRQIAALPFNLQAVTVSDGYRPIGFRFAEHIVSATARICGEEIVACGEANSSEVAQAKAISELAERATLIQLGSKFGAKSSNGWAAHLTHAQARSNAIFELVERDAVLSQWYSAIPFLEINQKGLPDQIQEWAINELSHSEFPILRILLSTQGIGPSITCVLMNSKGHGVCGHSTKLDFEDAINSSITEACRAAHLAIRRVSWKDSLKLKDMKNENLSPGSHAMFYAHHEVLPAWMFGREVSYVDALGQWRLRIEDCMADPQFDYQPVLTLPLAVGFATHPYAFELGWGATDAVKISESLAAVRMNLKKETDQRTSTYCGLNLGVVMKATNAKAAAIIALMGLLQVSPALAKGHTFTPIENLPPEQRQQIADKLNEVAKSVDIDWDELIVGVNEHGQITFRNKADVEMQTVSGFSCASSK